MSIPLLLLIGSIAGGAGGPVTDPHVRSYIAAASIPAFARKYGMKCSACHLAVPVLNRYGQAFKDNGYRMKVGTDELRANEPAYWPAFAWLWKNYEVDVERVGGRTVQQAGGIADGALVFGGLGSISDRVSFRFVPIVYENGVTFADAGWIRYNQAFGSDWLNIKVGSNELELPIYPGREYNMGASRFAVLYAYSVPGSVSRFSVLFPQPGIEIMGHDRGNRSRYSVNVFNSGWSAAGTLHVLRPWRVRPSDAPPRPRERIPPQRASRRVRSVRDLAGRTRYFRSQGSASLRRRSRVVVGLRRPAVPRHTDGDDGTGRPCTDPDGDPGPKVRRGNAAARVHPAPPTRVLQPSRNDPQPAPGCCRNPRRLRRPGLPVRRRAARIRSEQPVRLVARAQLLAVDDQAGGARRRGRNTPHAVARHSPRLLTGGRMSTRRRAAAVAALIAGALAAGAARLPAQTKDAARGRQVYERYCIQCHGTRADGAGEVARWSQPKPRDFRQGIFKFSSTPYGFLPTTADLERVLQNGLYGTRMPPFAALSTRERRDVIAYLQTLSPRWQTDGPGTPIAIADEPVATRESVTQGRKLFEANCAKCHGDGTGNGPSAVKGMVDDWGAPIAPANLALGRGKWARTARYLS